MTEEYLGRREEVEACARAVVEFAGDGVEVAGQQAIQIGLSGEIAADEAVCVLDPALLPGRVRAAEEEWGMQGGRDEQVIGVLAAVVGRDAVTGKRAETLHEDLTCIRRRLAGKASEEREAAAAFDQYIGNLALMEEKRVTFPVADLRPLIGGRRTGVDELTPGNRAGSYSPTQAQTALLPATPQILVQPFLATDG
jgi:hypothetical protein